MKTAFKSLLKILGERDYLGDIDIDGRIMFNIKIDDGNVSVVQSAGGLL